MSNAKKRLEELMASPIWQELSEEERRLARLHWNPDVILLPMTTERVRRWLEERAERGRRSSPIAHFDMAVELSHEALLVPLKDMVKASIPYPFHGDLGNYPRHMDIYYSDDGLGLDHAQYLHLDESGPWLELGHPHTDFFHADMLEDLHQDYFFQDGWFQNGDERDLEFRYRSDSHADHDDDSSHTDQHRDDGGFFDGHHDTAGHADGHEHDDAPHADGDDHQDAPYTDEAHSDLGFYDMHWDADHTDNHLDSWEHGDREHGDADGPYSDHLDGGGGGHADSFIDAHGDYDYVDHGEPTHMDHFRDIHRDSGFTGLDYFPEKDQLYDSLLASLNAIGGLLEQIEIRDPSFVMMLNQRLEKFMFELEKIPLHLD